MEFEGARKEQGVVSSLRQAWHEFGAGVVAATGLVGLGLVVGWIVAGRPPLEVPTRLIEVVLLTGAGLLLTWVWGELRRARGQQEAEAAVRKNLERYLADTLRGMSGCFFAVDERWTLTFANAPAEEMFGVPRGSAEGRTLWDVLPPERADVLRGRLVTAMERRFAARFEVEAAAAPAGTAPARWLEVHAYPSGEGLSVYFHDVSERKRAEAELARSEERYRSFVSQSSEGIWRFESDEPMSVGLPEDQQVEHFYRHHYLAECNDAMARMYGYDRAEQIVGARLGELVVPEAPENLEFHLAFIRSGYRLSDAESCEVDRHGETRFFLNNLVGIVEEGKLVRVWGTQRDVTDRKALEVERADLLEREREARQSAEAARRQAEAASRAKDEFLAVLSHELRTPLTPVLLTVSMLEGRAELTGPDAPAGLREQLETVRRNVELEARLIDDLLDLTRITHGKLRLELEAVDLPEVLERAVVMCRREGAAELVVERAEEASTASPSPRRPRLVRADAARLQQVLANLLNNALKFTPPAGRVVVRVHDLPAATAGGPERLAVEVSDTGVGFEPEMAERLFEAFEQGSVGASRRFGGLGLGLAISRALAEACGGRLTAHSDGPGRGATFTLELLLAPEPDPTGMAEGRTAHGPCAARAGRLRILLVEDHDSTRTVLAQLLEVHGHQVRTAGSVAAALDAAAAEDFDLVISDIGLPDGSGHELMRHLSGRVKGIALSGYGMDEDLRRSVEAGFVEHVTKPVDAGQLERAIERVTGA